MWRNNGSVIALERGDPAVFVLFQNVTPLEIILAIVFFFCWWRIFMEKGEPMFHPKLRVVSNHHVGQRHPFHHFTLHPHLLKNAPTSHFSKSLLVERQLSSYCFAIISISLPRRRLIGVPDSCEVDACGAHIGFECADQQNWPSL